MLFSVTDNNLKTSPTGHVQNSNGYDIIFRATDTTTCGGASVCTLDHEIERYNSSTGELIAWTVGGGVFVALVLFVFLWNIRSAFISIMAIPLSLLTAVIVLTWRGATLNTITLGGLAIAIGIVAIPAYARLTRGQVLAVRQREFITAARTIGATPLRIVLRHVFPNVSPISVMPFVSTSMKPAPSRKNGV